jgi:hypothetical protein
MGESRNPVLSFRETLDWPPAFAGVTGREKVITFGNEYIGVAKSFGRLKQPGVPTDW